MMAFYDDLAQMEADLLRWREFHPAKGDRLRLHGLEFVVVRERPLEVVGPSGKRKMLDAATLRRMERDGLR